MKWTKTEIAAINEQIKDIGEFRVHLLDSRLGNVSARLWHRHGHRVGYANGGGFDKRGSALGDAIQLFFAEELKTLALPRRDVRGRVVKGYYGLYERKDDGTRFVDGACGLDRMLDILVGLGFRHVRLITINNDSCIVLATGLEKRKEGRS